MIYNTGLKLLHKITEPSQEEIYNCPHYFGLSTEQVKQHGAPEFLLKVLDQFPWSGRPNVCQIRPQDFRMQRPNVDGSGWHCDNNVRLNNGGVSETKNIHDFRLMTVAFGGMCNTDFVTTPMELPDFTIDPLPTYLGFSKYHFQWTSSDNGQVAEYTSLDFHRANPNHNTGKMRLFLVVFESDDVRGSEWVLPSIREQEK